MALYGNMPDKTRRREASGDPKGLELGSISADFRPSYPALRRAVDAGDWKAGGAALNRIRQMVGSNLLLGLLTLGFATLGRYLA